MNPLFWVEILENGRDYNPNPPLQNDILTGLVEELTRMPETEQFLELLEILFKTSMYQSCPHQHRNILGYTPY